MSIPLDEPTTRETELKKCVRDVLAEEIAHRRERREQIVTWASTLLIAIIGGTIALTSPGHPLGYRQQVYLSVVIVGLAAWAIIWILYIWKLERCVEDEIKKYNDALGIRREIQSVLLDTSHWLHFDWMHVVPLFLLASFALALVRILCNGNGALASP